MPAPYQDIVGQLRVGFPQPVSDRTQDAYFVFSSPSAPAARGTNSSEAELTQ